MKNELKLIVVLMAAALFGGCSSGGGMKVTRGPDLRPAPVDHGCGTVPGYDIQCQPYLPADNPQSATDIPLSASGAVVMSGTRTDTDSLATSMRYAREQSDHQKILPADFEPIAPNNWASFRYVNGQSNTFIANDYFRNTLSTTQNLAAIDQPGIDIVRHHYLDANPVYAGASPFVSTHEAAVDLFANPYVIGWDYQSFGVWATDGYIVARTFGATTPGSALPIIGHATFSGKLAGFYVSPTGAGSIVAANVTINADFSNRALSFSSSGTTLTRDAATMTAVENLNLSGSLTYSPGANLFTGTLTNAGGTMNGTSRGQFYGPAAQELGGIVTVKSPTTVETLIGAYGAKR